MSTVIKNRVSALSMFPPVLWEMLPSKLQNELTERSGDLQRIEELRIRCGRFASLTTDRGSIRLRYVCDREELDELVLHISGRSLYAHRDSIAEGYLTVTGGIRVGICGRATVENGRVIGVYDVDGLNIRLPKRFLQIGEPVCALLRKGGREHGVLIYGPPGEGKTTLLRSVTAQMASGQDPWRVAVIDTRGELGFSLDSPELFTDLLTGYPRALGIEIATRTMNAQLIVCDEIGDPSEAEAMLHAQNCGIPFLASAHGVSVEGMFRRKDLLRLHRARVFGSYVGIRRNVLGGDFSYHITPWEEADGILQACGILDGGT